MISANSMQYLNQQGGMYTYVDIEDDGTARAYKLVPCSHWHNGNKFPHEVEKDLRMQSFRTTKIEGLEYYLVPESTTNAVGNVTKYVHPEQTQHASIPDAKAPPAVQKYMKRDSRKPVKVSDN